MKRLILLRHARARDRSESGRDRDRPLSDIGRQQAASQAKRLKSAGVKADRIIASPALRAEETAAIASQTLGDEITPDWVAGVYDATPSELIRVLEEHAGEEVLLVGHNPGISGLASLLSGDSVSLSAGGFVIIDFEPPATHPLQPGSGRVSAYRASPHIA